MVTIQRQRFFLLVSLIFFGKCAHFTFFVLVFAFIIFDNYCDRRKQGFFLPKKYAEGLKLYMPLLKQKYTI